MELKQDVSLVDGLKALIDPTLPLVSNLSNVSSLLAAHFKTSSWVGFYLKKENEDILYLGPFQGSLACTLIPFGKGVCGTCCLKKETIIVDNVLLFPGHIACSSSSRSEIVVPIIKNEEVVGVIDLDSDSYSSYTIEDGNVLEEVANILSSLF